jgi:LmbE family N-acetylglucosaminyl deacetylase
VHLFICTDGSKGTWDPDADLATLAATREEEQLLAGKVLGVAGLRFPAGGRRRAHQRRGGRGRRSPWRSAT